MAGGTRRDAGVRGDRRCHLDVVVGRAGGVGHVQDRRRHGRQRGNDAKDAFTTGFDAIKSVVETVWNFIGGIFIAIGNGIGNVADKLRSIPGIGSLIPGNAKGSALGFAGGSAGVSTTGVVSGPGTGTSDSILARISAGEGIVTANAM